MSPEEKEAYQKVVRGEMLLKDLEISDESLDRMNKYLIKSHNSRVKPEDIVFCNGDFCFRNTSGGKPGEGVRIKAEEWVRQLNGNTVFIQGNHDRNNSLSTPVISCVIEMGKREIYMCHNPARIDYRYSLCFVGHVHNHWKFKKVRNPYDGILGSYPEVITLVNVGVDVWGFSPCSFNEIIGALKKWERTKEGAIIHEPASVD